MKVLNTQFFKRLKAGSFLILNVHKVRSAPISFRWLRNRIIRYGLATTSLMLFLAPSVLSSPRKMIRTYQDFETSFLYRELSFKNLKNVDQYRLYKDSNNNYLVALQVDSQGEIHRERILPMPKVASKAQNEGILLFTIDFIFGDGAALQDIEATYKIQPFISKMLTETGCQIDAFKVCEVQDPWGIRAGVDIQTKDAKPWDLSFPVETQFSDSKKTPDTTNLTNEIQKLRAQLLSKEEELKASSGSNLLANQRLQQEIDRRTILENSYLGLQNQLKQLQNDLVIKQRDFESKKAELEAKYTERLNAVKVDRDIAIGKLLNLQELWSAYEARFKVNRGLSSTSSSSPELALAPKTSDYPEDHETPQEKSFKDLVASKITQSVRRLIFDTDVQLVIVKIDFEVEQDGSPTNLRVFVQEPESKSVTEVIKIAKTIVLAAAPFPRVRTLNSSKVEVSLEIQQNFEGKNFDSRLKVIRIQTLKSLTLTKLSNGNL